MKTSHPPSVASLEEVASPCSLVSLQFTRRSVTDLPALASFKNLTELDLSGNCLANGLASLQALKFLRRLNLAENGIEEIWEMPGTLEQLSLAGNRLTVLGAPLLQLGKLNTLDISRNLLSSIKPLAALPGLRCLYANSNQLTNLEGVDCLPTLVELDVSNNPIESEAALAALEFNLSVSVVILKDTPYYRKTQDVFDSFREGAFDLDHFEDGIFYRNLDKLKDLKSSRFKRKLRNLKNLIADPESPDWGSSKRSSCVQSAYPSSRLEESFTREDSKLPVVRLELPLLQQVSSASEELDSVDQCTQQHRYKPRYPQLSVEETTPWRSENLDLERSKKLISTLQTKIQTLEEQLEVKPENQLELLFADLVSYCLPEYLNTEVSFSPVKYSQAVDKIKAIVDDRNDLIDRTELLQVDLHAALAARERLMMKLSDFESWRARQTWSMARSSGEKDELADRLTELSLHNNSLLLENEGLKAELGDSTRAMMEKLRELEAENDRLRRRARESQRSMDVSQVETSVLDASYVRRLPEEGKVLIDKQVGHYVLRLKDKISRLTAKLHKLREQRDEYRSRVQQYRLALS
jgi:Leucine-rich repeat (LRR) protein